MERFSVEKQQWFVWWGVFHLITIPHSSPFEGGNLGISWRHQVLSLVFVSAELNMPLCPIMVLTWQWHFLVSFAGKQNLEQEKMPTAIGFKEYLFQKHQAQLSNGFFFFFLLKKNVIAQAWMSLRVSYQLRLHVFSHDVFFYLWCTSAKIWKVNF